MQPSSLKHFIKHVHVYVSYKKKKKKKQKKQKNNKIHLCKKENSKKKRKKKRKEKTFLQHQVLEAVRKLSALGVGNNEKERQF